MFSNLVNYGKNREIDLFLGNVMSVRCLRKLIKIQTSFNENIWLDIRRILFLLDSIFSYVHKKIPLENIYFATCKSDWLFKEMTLSDLMLELKVDLPYMYTLFL